MEKQITAREIIELEAELDRVLSCTRALRNRLRQASLVVPTVVEGSADHGQVSPSSYGFEESAMVHSVLRMPPSDDDAPLSAADESVGLSDSPHGLTT
jgi:hypothetical protein